MPLISTMAGALLGGGSSGGGTQTQTNEPWAPAQPWLQNQITTGQNLQNYYQSHPLNSMQQQGYQNMAANLDSWNSSVAPALQGVANRLMGSNYSRTIGQQNYQQPSIGGMGGMGGGQSGGMGGALGGYASGIRGGIDQLGQGQGYAQMMGNSPMMSMGGQGGLLGPAVQQQFQQPQMDVTQGYTPYGLLDFSSLVPNVDQINKDAEAASNSKKPKVDGSTTTSTQWTDNTGGGGM